MKAVEPHRADNRVIKSSWLKLGWLIFLMGACLLLPMCMIPSMAGWLGTIVVLPFFGMSVYLYRPSKNYLLLDADGFITVTAGRPHRVRWADVVGFHVHKEARDKLIGILYSPSFRQKMSGDWESRTDPQRAWVRDLYVLSAEQICDVLNEAKAAHEQQKNDPVASSGLMGRGCLAQ